MNYSGVSTCNDDSVDPAKVDHHINSSYVTKHKSDF